MEITNNNIEKALKYFDKLDDTKYETLVDNIIEEQAYLSTFIQQNLDAIFGKNEQIKDLSYNLYFTILYLYKNKLGDSYPIIDKEKLTAIIENNNGGNHKQEELGDFLFTQLVDSKFGKEEILKVIGLLNVVINCVDLS